uniref:ATP synthase F0 subunit 8 n=1 Tax=Acrobeloides nanus TaxID=290746 RepID=A0A914D3C6_9BILA
MNMFMTNPINTELALILIILVFCIDWSVMFWSIWVMYYHYCYLRGMDQIDKRLSVYRPEKQIDFDPVKDVI